MSGGGGGIIIIGDKDIATQIKDHIGKVAQFRQARALAIIAAYEANENSITRDDQQFLLRCAADIVDNS
jgi:hypothetical protein